MLINNGHVAYDIAKSSYEKMKTESNLSDAHMRKACFELQQTIEFYLKGIIELFGEIYPEQHALDLLLNILQPLYEKYNDNELEYICEQISNKSDMFDTWQTKPRYLLSFTSNIKNIEKAFEICDDLRNFINKKFGEAE